MNWAWFAHGYVRGWLFGKVVGLAVIGVILLLAGCPKPPSPPPVTPDASDAAVYVPPCREACAHIGALGCQAGTDVESACLVICPKILRSTWRTCVFAAKTCQAVDACDQ